MMSMAMRLAPCSPAPSVDSMDAWTDEELDRWLEAYVPLSNLPTPPPKCSGELDEWVGESMQLEGWWLSRGFSYSMYMFRLSSSSLLLAPSVGSPRARITPNTLRGIPSEFSVGSTSIRFASLSIFSVHP
jgi:hypothetical protein